MTLFVHIEFQAKKNPVCSFFQTYFQELQMNSIVCMRLEGDYKLAIYKFSHFLKRQTSHIPTYMDMWQIIGDPPDIRRIAS